MNGKVNHIINQFYGTDKKDTVPDMLERGFYTGVGAAVGLVVICATPEIMAVAGAVTLGCVVGKGVSRCIDKVTKR